MAYSTLRHSLRRVFPRLGPLAVVAAVVLGTSAAPARAETVYISDVLYVELRTGPSIKYRILRRLKSGERLQVLERNAEAGYVRVSTGDGAEGWVPEQYVTGSPIARERLEAVNREVERLTRTVTELRSRLQSEESDRTETEQTNSSLTTQLSTLQQELAEIRSISAGAMDTAAANKRLTELNARLREELDALVGERDRLEDDAEQRWLMLGGGLVLLGLILGIVIKSRPRRSAWS